MDIIDQLKLMEDGKVTVFPRDQTIVAARETIERLRAALERIKEKDKSPVYRVSDLGSAISHWAYGSCGKIASDALAHEQSASKDTQGDTLGPNDIETRNDAYKQRGTGQ